MKPKILYGVPIELEKGFIAVDNTYIDEKGEAVNADFGIISFFF